MRQTPPLNVLRNLIAIGITRLFYPERELQEVKVAIRDGEVRDGLVHVVPYGFAHLPHAGAEALSVFPGGDKGSGFVVSVYDRRYRLQLTETGEVALYDDIGQTVHLTRTGIVIRSEQKVTLDTPTVICTGDVEVSGISFLKHLHGGIAVGSGKTKPPE